MSKTITSNTVNNTTSKGANTMTFLEWCQLDASDDRPIELSVKGRTVVKAGESIPAWIVEHYKPMELAEDPVLENGIWKVNLKGANA